MLGYFKTAYDVLSGEKSLQDGIKEGVISYATGNIAPELMTSMGGNPLASPEMGNMALENYDMGMDGVQADIGGFTATPEVNQIAMNDYAPIQNNIGEAIGPNMSHQQELMDVTQDYSQGNFGTPQTPDYANSINTSDPTKQMLTNGYGDTFTDGVRDQATNQTPNMGLINPVDTAQADVDDGTFLGLTKGEYAQTALDAGVGALANQRPTVQPTAQVMPITQGQPVMGKNAIGNGMGLISNPILLEKLRQQGIA